MPAANELLSPWARLLHHGAVIEELSTVQVTSPALMVTGW
jgi:hypothetical protein